MSTPPPGPDFVTCPECGRPAEVEWREALGSTDGDVEHCKVRCVDRHWFILPTERLLRGDDGPTPDSLTAAPGQARQQPRRRR